MRVCTAVVYVSRYSSPRAPRPVGPRPLARTHRTCAGTGPKGICWCESDVTLSRRGLVFRTSRHSLEATRRCEWQHGFGVWGAAPALQPMRAPVEAPRAATKRPHIRRVHLVSNAAWISSLWDPGLFLGAHHSTSIVDIGTASRPTSCEAKPSTQVELLLALR